jgi:hypothetical protein
MKDHYLYTLMEAIESIAFKLHERELLEAQARDTQALNEANSKGDRDEAEKIQRRINDRMGHLRKKAEYQQFSRQMRNPEALKKLSQYDEEHQRKNS